MHTHLPFRRSPWVSLLLGFVLTGSIAAAADDGHDRAKDFHGKLDDSRKELDDVRKRFEKAEERYQQMLSAKSNHRNDRYEDFVDRIKGCEERRDKLEERHKEMNKQAKKFFDAWRKSSKKIEDGGLRARAQERIDASRARYERLSESYRTVIDHYSPMTKAMRDQSTYLSHELNDGATASLSDDAAKMQDQVEAFLLLIDESRQMASDYMDSVNPG